MRVLILPDLHNRIQIADKIMQSVDHDLVIQLGDIWDQYSDTLEDTAKSAWWVRKQIEENPKYIQILGNHCAAYLYSKTYLRDCSGFTPQKNEVINKIIKIEHKERFKLFYYLPEGNFLISHSGFDHRLISGFIVNDISKLEKYCNDALEGLKANIYHPLFGAGRDRGGSQEVGGCLWIDFRRIIPLLIYNQIVGHTIVKTPMISYVEKDGVKIKEFNNGLVSPKNPKRLDKGNCVINLDTNNAHYGLITDGVLTVHETPKKFFKEYNKEIEVRNSAVLLSAYEDLMRHTTW